jgi:hypothetical protein
LQRARIGSGANLAVILIAAHDIAESKKDAGENEHQHEEADDVPALKHAITSSAASTP